MQIFKKYAANPLINNYLKVFSVDVLVKTSGFILLPVYLKLMTQEEYGLFGYLMAIITTFALVFNLGIYTAQSKLYHEYEENKKGTVLFTLNAILFAFIAILMLAILIFDVDYIVIAFLFKNPINYAEYRVSVLLGVVVSVYSLMIVNYFLTSEDIRKLQWFNISRIVLINVVVIAMLVISGDQDNALVRVKFSVAVEFLIIVFFAFYYVRRMRFKFDKDVAKRAMGIGVPILISAILGLFINLSDRFFIEKFGSLKALSIYNLGLAVSGVIPFAFASFQNIWLPQFLKEKDIQSNRARARKVTFRLLIIFTSLSILILFLLKLMLVTNIIDQKYDEIMPLLPILMITSIISSLTPMYSNHLVYLEKLYVIILIGIPIAALGIILNMNLVPIYHIYGAAVSSLITNGCYLVAYLILVNYFYKEKMGS